MPINRRRFDNIDDDTVGPGTNAERILQFLIQNTEYAYSMNEIAEETDIKRGSVGPTLSRLEDDGLVDHKGTYWRVSDSYLASREGLVHANEVATPYDNGQKFDTAAWAKQAEDDGASAYITTDEDDDAE